MSINKIDIQKQIDNISRLKIEINEKILDIGDSQTNVFKHLKRKSLESILSRLDVINSILNIKKYKIVFIGTIGAGKTTAICHLFNLVGKFDKQEELGKKTVTIKKTESLLATGSGRTTISEVIMKSSDKTYIQIDPYPRDVVEDYIKDFCESLYKDTNEGDTMIETELERAIRSFIGWKKTGAKDKDGKFKNFDPAKQEALKYPLNELIEIALKNSNLDTRCYDASNSILVCPPDQDEKIWLKNNFELVNRGEQASLSIPKKIYTYVGKNVLGGSEMTLFDSVIDTKGIGENPIRPDLTSYIENEDTICLFTTRYNDAPEANIRTLFKYFMSQRSKSYEQRFVIFVMPRKGEPERENDGDNSWDTGISIKKDVIIDALRNVNINFIPDNIVFFDALKFYDDKYRLMQDYSEDDVQDDKTNVILWLDNIVENRKEILIQEIRDIENQFSLIVSGKELTEDDKREINKTIEDIHRLSELGSRIPDFVYEDFIEKYIEYYASNYPAWNTKDAIHRRLGVFDDRNYNTYFDAKVVAEGYDEDEMLKKFTKKVKEEVIDRIQQLGNTHPDLESLTPEIIIRFEIAYDVFISNVGSSVQHYLEKYNRTTEFWSDMINRRGKGKGYNEDVCTMFRRHLQTLSTDFPGKTVDAGKIVQQFAEKYWKDATKEVLNFFVSY